MKGIIDRIEGKYAVIYIDNEYINFPKEFLPQGATEGTHIKINIEIDHESTKSSYDRIESLLNKLKNKSQE